MKIAFIILNPRTGKTRVLNEKWNFNELPRKGDRVFSKIEDAGFEVSSVSWNNRDKIITIWLDE